MTLPDFNNPGWNAVRQGLEDEARAAIMALIRYTGTNAARLPLLPDKSLWLVFGPPQAINVLVQDANQETTQ